MARQRRKHIIGLWIILATCLINLIGHTTFARSREAQVLILNSYHPNFTWTSDMATSILNELTDSNLNIKIDTEYMDWKNHPNASNLENLYTSYQTKYKFRKIDLLITTDDKALEFALEHRGDLFSNAPIVFAGTNEEGEKELAQRHDNITGVIEHIDLGETIAMALHINPNIKDLHIIHDQTESGQSTYAVIEKIIRLKYPNIEPISETNNSHAGIANKMGRLEEDSAILITTHYHDLFDRAMGFEEFCKLISDVSQVPVFHMYDFTMGYGNIGGAMLSAKEQGKAAGQLALRVLSGEEADNIPVIRDFPMTLMFDYEQLQRFNVPMERVPKEAKIINEPFSFLKTYRNLVIMWLIIIIVLIGFIIILLVYMIEIRRGRNKVQMKNIEITQAYQELSASDEELQQQLEEIHSIQNKLRDMAYYDVLTKMPNKRALQDDFPICIGACNGQKGAVIFIDADNFKIINDTLGHSMGDRFIIEIGKRLEQVNSETIKVYRMGGDEFLLLVTNMPNIGEIEKLAKRIILKFEKGFLIEDMTIHTTVSAGVAIYPDHGDTAEDLMMRADIAMYKAKASGKGRYIFYDSKMNDELIERADIERNLRSAIENRELSLHYQPQYDFKTREIIGFEALLRWNSKELGWISPFRFIQVAEDSRMIIPIGRWVLETACRFIKSIHDLGYPNYTMAVNISSLQIIQDEFVELVLRTLKENDLEAKHLEIEMTETTLIKNFEIVVKKIEVLREHGVRVALDDFGTGYSSLNYLNRIPIDTLKIDKSFVDTLVLHEQGRKIVSVLIDLGHGMGLGVVAEGVETEEEFAYLKEYGCNTMQGYLLSKPLPEEEVVKLLKT